MMASSNGWIGVDLDGTLALWGPEYFGPGHNETVTAIGAPVPRMVKRIQYWRAQGIEVRIVTARVGVYGDVYGVGFADRQRVMIETWCKQHIGEVLPVTASKDFDMMELWDDRCVQVLLNTGLSLQEYNDLGFQRTR